MNIAIDCNRNCKSKIRLCHIEIMLIHHTKRDVPMTTQSLEPAQSCHNDFNVILITLTGIQTCDFLYFGISLITIYSV